MYKNVKHKITKTLTKIIVETKQTNKQKQKIEIRRNKSNINK